MLDHYNAIKDVQSGKTKKEKTSNSFEFTSFWADANNYKKYGSIAGGGYIWHTTGSGKTLTSFKSARLASQLPYIDKVLFVVDRKDLDYHTMKEYDRFEKGAANSNTSTAILKRQLEDPNLAISLGAQASYRKTENFHIIQDEINRLALDKRKTPVIIIDEANYIKNAVLNDLKILFNFEMDSKDRAVILLVGLPQLNNTLGLSIHEPLRQRIIMNYNIDGYSKEEGRAYIEWKLKKAGCAESVFEDAAIEAVLNASDGAPPMISKLCHS